MIQNTPQKQNIKYYTTQMIKYHIIICINIIIVTIFSQIVPLNIFSNTKTKQQSFFKQIIKSYMFINDFNIKEEERPISTEHPTWKYPFKITQYTFPIYYEITDLANEWPATQGEGLEIQHLNFARIAFLEKKYDKAKNILLSAKAKFGKQHPYARRLNYLIGLIFLTIANNTEKTANTNSSKDNIKLTYANAATFLSAALLIDTQLDPLIDKIYPKQIYNLAAIYYNYQRYAAAYGAADKGLNFLRKTARTDFRANLRRILVETHIQNRSYLDAAKELDMMIRQEENPQIASTGFARMGDIYFDLNNYELAEEQYNLANKINNEIGKINPIYFILRGESLFWLSKFSDSQKMFTYALESLAAKEITEELDNEIIGYAQLRIADSYLLLNNKQKALLEYFKITQDFPNTTIAKIAHIRSACLELPNMDKNNTKHTLKLLKKFKNQDLHPKAIELAWTCEALYYAQKEKNEKMIQKIQTFYEKYPNSILIKQLITPVKKLQASKINNYFNTNDYYAAISFFEKTRNHLFTNIPKDIQIKLFEAYTDTYQPQKAQEFWQTYFNAKSDNDLSAIRLATVASEMIDISNKQDKKKWQKQLLNITKILNNKKLSIQDNSLTLNYLNRIKSTQSLKQNFIWIYNLVQYWNHINKNKYICNITLPLLYTYINISSLNPYEISFVNKKVLNIIDQNITELLKTNESCAISLLDMELKILQQDPQELIKRYKLRLQWKLSPALASIFWIASQKLDNYDYKNEAKKICEFIVKSTSQDIAEHTLAKIYLNKF